jgi:uncharacterized protein (TIGR02646 family)
VRKFNRVEAPAGWAASEAKWNQQWVTLLQGNPRATFSWYRSGGQSARDVALPALKEQTLAHCSFCDGFPVEGISRETIEHFRPKCEGKFPERAYSWENLYYCCDQCQSCKGEGWDEGLLAADADDYTFERFFEFDFTTGEMRPSTNATEGDRQRATITLQMYGLDSPSRRRRRCLELRKWTRTKAKGRVLDEFAYRDYLAPVPGSSKGN